jgi:putative transposase
MALKQEWFTSRDLAGMPGMAKTYSGVIRWCEKNLAVTRGKLRGKGLEYSRASLPVETQEYLADKEIQASIEYLPHTAPSGKQTQPDNQPGRQVTPSALPPVPPTDAQKLCGLARMLVLRALRDIEEIQGCSTRRAAHQLLARARAGELTPALLSKLQQACDERGRNPADAANADGLPSPGSLQRWARQHAQGHDLTPRASAVPSLGVLAWYRPFFALTDRPQKPTLKQAHEQLLAAWRPEWAATPGGLSPGYDAVVRAYNKRSKLDQIKGRHTGSALRAKTLYMKRTYHAMAPFTEVHSDGWTTHFTAPHPVTGQFVTYEIWHFHDVATRYVTPLAVGQTENTDVILLGLQNCVRVGGVPAIWQTDHTSSVKNQRVMDEHSGLAERLGISVVHPAQVGNSQANGIAENFNTWLDIQARELATYQHPTRMDSGTFVRVRRLTNAMVRAADRPQERALARERAMRMGKGIVFDSHAQAMDWIVGQAQRWNNHRHRELPKVQDPHTGRWTHMTPQQSLDAAIAAGWEPMKLPDDVLLEQFRPHLRKKVTRGTVTPFGGMRYHHSELAHFEGEEVLVVVDPENPDTVRVKDLEGRLIARAEFLAAVGPRTQSMDEHSQRKRADAQVRLRVQQINEIEARNAMPALEMPAEPDFEIPWTPAAAVPEHLAHRRASQPQEHRLDPIDTFLHIQRAKEAAKAAASAGTAEEGDPEKKVAAG